jgi:hypothetical protein
VLNQGLLRLLRLLRRLESLLLIYPRLLEEVLLGLLRLKQLYKLLQQKQRQ